MRYTILFVGLMIFFIWDGLFNSGIYLDQMVRGLRNMLQYVGLM